MHIKKCLRFDTTGLDDSLPALPLSSEYAVKYAASWLKSVALHDSETDDFGLDPLSSTIPNPRGSSCNAWAWTILRRRSQVLWTATTLLNRSIRLVVLIQWSPVRDRPHL